MSRLRLSPFEGDSSEILETLHFNKISYPQDLQKSIVTSNYLVCVVWSTAIISARFEIVPLGSESFDMRVFKAHDSPIGKLYYIHADMQSVYVGFEYHTVLKNYHGFLMTE